MAFSLATGRAPGSPRQTSHVRVFGGSPNDSSQPQNIFVRVLSCTWISSPMTGSYARAATASATGRRSVEADDPLDRVCGIEDDVLAERRAGDLEPHGQPLGHARGDG